MPGTYSPGLVVLSLFVAILAASVALSTSGRIAAANSRGSRAAWLIAGGGCMGGGIWGMHFIGMLAFSLPCGITYDPLVTIASMVPGMLASACALYVISRGDSVGFLTLGIGAVLMGAGIGAMHYSGMAALRADALLRYDITLVAVSVLVAVLLAYISLSALVFLRQSELLRPVALPVAAIVMGCSVAGMHYTAMQASLFFALPETTSAPDSFDPTTLAIVITLLIVCFGIATLAASFAGRQFETATQLRREIRHREALEHEARADHIRLQTILDNVQEAFITIDCRGTILHWSPGAERVFGYVAEEAIGRNVALIMPDAVAFHHDGYLDSYLKTRDAKIIGIGREVEGRRKDGVAVPIELNVSEAKVEGKTLFTGILRDITERNRIHAELIQAREQADAANAAKSLFLANMSHEIRTPLNPIIGMAHLLQKTKLDRVQSEYARKIHQSGRHLVKIINDLLDFSKIEAGQLVLEKTEFDLDEILESISSVVSERAAAKGLELVFHIPLNIPRQFSGDPLRLSQVLINFANNAVKFTETGEIDIIVGLREETEDRVHLRFSVKDTGIGISEENQAKLWRSFQQADESTTRKFGGTGLGLAIARRLASLMGGTVGVYSSVGAGSTFWIDLWLEKSDRVDPVLMPEPRLRGRKVLVVDDNPSARHTLSDMLESMTFVVDAVEDGPSAIEAVRASPNYDLAFVDWRMPGMDGLRTIQKIQSFAPALPLPGFILVTAYGRDEVLSASQEAGLDDVLIKPVNPSQLFDSAIRVLRHRASGATEPDRESPTPAPADSAVLDGRAVLVVEDNDLNQEVAVGLLASAGAHVETAENGAEALEILESRGFDLILMDIQMPVMDGFTATREIRKRHPDLACPIIAMTANALSGDREKCLEAGMNEHVAKPIDPDELFEVLSLWLLTDPVDPRVSGADAAQTGEDHDQAEADPPPLFVHRSVDSELGMRRVLGRRDRYVEMLVRYRRGQTGVVQRIADALAAGDRETAEREAHTARSVNGNIGAMEMASIAEKLETAIRDQADFETVHSLLDDLADGLTPILDGISRLSDPAVSETVSAKGMNDAAREHLLTLVRYLDADDAIAQDFLAEHETSIRGALGEETYRPLAAAVESFDFDAALTICREFTPDPQSPGSASPESQSRESVS